MIGAGSYLAVAYCLTSPMNDSMSGEAQYYPIEFIWRVEWVYSSLIGFGCFLMLRNGKWRHGLESLG